MQNSDQIKKAMLIILDGWGLGQDSKRSAIDLASTPYMDSLLAEYPNATLTTHGEAVGLPEGQMGNSEVGHLNIGAGRIVYQDLVKINKAIDEGRLDDSGKLKAFADYAVAHNRVFHLIGLCSDGGVHSHIQHLYGIMDYLTRVSSAKLFIHAITDGRDTDPKSGLGWVRQLVEKCRNSTAELATVTGRYYAMDRDRRWDRTKVAYDALVRKSGVGTDDPILWIQEQYSKGMTDEFLMPCIANNSGFEGIRDGDVVFFFNFRTDRPRQLTKVLSQTAIPDYQMEPLKLKYLTMTSYDPEFKNVEVLFEKDNLRETMGEVVSRLGLNQLRIAETEKYPHVTFFFSGGREVKFDGEDRILIPSPKVATYDLKPEMSAVELTDALIEAMGKKSPHFICLNYANPDMVGHTGDLKSAIKAVETVDVCLSRLVPICRKENYEVLIIADHGNSDYMVNDNGSPNTAHTTNLVPILYVGGKSGSAGLEDGILADVAPTLLNLMGIPVPLAMTGRNLVKYQ